MKVPCSASTYLYRDQASQLEMPLHHGEPTQEVSTLGAKVWEFPGQKCQPEREGSKRNEEHEATVEATVVLHVQKADQCLRGIPSDSPPSPIRQRLVSAATGQVGGRQRRQVNRFVVRIHDKLPIWSERDTALVAIASRLFLVLDFFFPFHSGHTPGASLGPLTKSPAVHGAHTGAKGLRPATH